MKSPFAAIYIWEKPINFQGQRSHFNVTGPLQRILALGSLWAGYSLGCSNLVCILDMKKEEAYSFSRSNVTFKGH